MTVDARSAASGAVSVLPGDDASVVEAVRRAGGTVVPLGAATRGIVWVANSGAAKLADALERHPDVSWVQLPWAGVDSFAATLERFRDDGRVWTSAKGSYARPVAEHALMLALGVLRESPRRARAREWEADERGRSLFGARVVVVGGGGITEELLRLLEPFGVEATVVRRSEVAVAGAARTVTDAALRDVLGDAEVLFLAAALTERTRGMVGARELALLPDGAVLVNVARGALVDTDALVAELASGRLGGAGLDVTEPEPLPAGHPLWQLDNALVTPHVADTEAMTVPLFAARVQANVAAFLGRGEWVGRIDLHAGY
ncbi:phosphoglycerate dehydrogenase-like enzyme [Agromyces terreus]|uniref:Phosphoglycerate dehydrogenase-like enzyme n=1 Tax=Agromyces terreus TaxID=424795 RepID=A0A9X2GZ60_9MICO|nr:NAD(P)-dependent oxidoreductase [Agromyces terreus]MCP2371775.1 phosphoglycerate dehydrogenase-like enzyme [Agromyces terreus]